MSEKEIQITRTMVKAIFRDGMNKLALWSILGIGSFMLTGAVWVGTIQTDVKHLKADESASDKLDMIIITLDEMKKDIRENRNHNHKQ